MKNSKNKLLRGVTATVSYVVTSMCVCSIFSFLGQIVSLANDRIRGVYMILEES